MTRGCFRGVVLVGIPETYATTFEPDGTITQAFY